MAGFLQALGGGLLGGICGGVFVAHVQYFFWPWLRDWWRSRQAKKEHGGLLDMQIHAGPENYFPPPEDRQALGQIMAYMVELGELAAPVQQEAMQIVRAKMHGEPHILTPETARYLILLAGLNLPDHDEVWELLDEACDMLGREHLVRP